MTQSDDKFTTCQSTEYIRCGGTDCVGEIWVVVGVWMMVVLVVC